MYTLIDIDIIHHLRLIREKTWFNNIVPYMILEILSMAN